MKRFKLLLSFSGSKSGSKVLWSSKSDATNESSDTKAVSGPKSSNGTDGVATRMLKVSYESF